MHDNISTNEIQRLEGGIHLVITPNINGHKRLLKEHWRAADMVKVLWIGKWWLFSDLSIFWELHHTEMHLVFDLNKFYYPKLDNIQPLWQWANNVAACDVCVLIRSDIATQATPN